jgi:hypothetical protein
VIFPCDISVQCRCEGAHGGLLGGAAMGRHRGKRSFVAFGAGPAAVAALGVTATFAALMASCGGPSSSAQADGSNAPASSARLIPSSSVSRSAVGIDSAAEAAALSPATQTAAVVPPVPPTPSRARLSTTVAPTSKPAPTTSAATSSATPQYVKVGASCTHAGTYALSAPNKRVVCLGGSDHKLTWHAF